MRILQVNYSDVHGGASRAAQRIHDALWKSGLDSHQLVDVDALGEWTAHGSARKWAKLSSRLRPYLVRPLKGLLKTANPVIHTPAIVNSRIPGRINSLNADVVHLHSMQDEMLSIADVSRIRPRIVWTLHDMWGFCGAEHYTTDHRWREGYSRHNRPSHESGFDLNRWTWQRKRRHWRRPHHVVCPSQWLADCAKASALMRNWPVTVVPYPIDLERWQPINQRLARHLLALPQDVPLLLFGAKGGGSDPRKGFDLLLAALAHLRNESCLHGLQLVVFGQPSPTSQPELGFPIHYAGHLHDDLSLRVLYSASDAMVIPSRQDNLPLTGVEAHACGVPVVAFHTCGLPDVVDHRVTGALAQPFDPASLAVEIRWVIEDHQRRNQLSVAARERATRLWAVERISALYRDIYEAEVRKPAGVEVY